MSVAAVAVGRPDAIPRSGGSGRAVALAVLMHALLGGLLFFGIRWQSSPPATIQAELWSAVPQTAAPAPRPAVVPPTPKVEAPRPEPRVEPKSEPEPPAPKADIVEKVPVKVEPKKAPVRVEAPKPEPKPDLKPQPKAEAKPQPKLQPPTPKAEPKPNPELLRLQKQVAVEAPVRPPSELDSLLAAAGKESTGKDQKTSGPRGSEGYKARLVAAIRSQMRYPGTAPGNPFVSLRIEQLPTGEVVNVAIVKSSGVAAFDQAVERAVRAASPLPRDERGQVERVLTPDYYMYDK